MHNLHRLTTDTLIDMLSTQTDAFFRMQKVGTTEEEFARCRLTLRAIQKELDMRKKRDLNINMSNEGT